LIELVSSTFSEGVGEKVHGVQSVIVAAVVLQCLVNGMRAIEPVMAIVGVAIRAASTMAGAFTLAGFSAVRLLCHGLAISRHWQAGQNSIGG